MGNASTIRLDNTVVTARDFKSMPYKNIDSTRIPDQTQPSLASLECQQSKIVARPPSNAPTSDQNRFFKGKVFLRKSTNLTLEAGEVKSSRQPYRHASSQSAISEDISVISSIQRSRQAKREISRTLDDAAALLAVSTAKPNDDLSERSQAANCQTLYKQQLVALLRQKATELTEGKSLLTSTQDIIQWDIDFKAEKFNLLTRLGLVADYSACQFHQSTATNAIRAPSFSIDKRSVDQKTGKARLLRTLNEGPDYHLLFWGDSRHGKTGVKSDELVTVPTFFAGGSFKALALGAHSSVAVDSKGRLFAWGRGDLLGTQGLDRRSPLLIKSMANRIVVQVACGDSHSLCLTADGAVFSWVSLSD